MKIKLLTVLLACWLTMPVLAQEKTNPDYEQVVSRVAGMTTDPAARELAAKYGLDIINITWEDTGRFEGSAVGPNISDMTIQVHPGSKESRRMTCMPVIRFPNFTDKTLIFSLANSTPASATKKARNPKRFRSAPCSKIRAHC